jgi:hypothetical protein
MCDAGARNRRANADVCFSAAHPLLHARVVVDRAFGGDELIGESVPHDRLAAAVSERTEIGLSVPITMPYCSWERSQNAWYASA